MFIYEVYNTKNGKSYIGLTTNNLDTRKSQHLRSAKAGSNSHFHKALRKYGESAFEWGVVMICSSRESLCKKEMLVISLYEPEQLYNKSLGGEHSAFGMRHTEEVKAVCSEHAKRRWDGKRVKDSYPDFVFTLPTYKEAKKYGVPKTTWYRHKIDLT